MDRAAKVFVAKAPEACTDLAEVRAGIDEVDGWLIGLLARRLAYCEKTTIFKDQRAQVRDEERVAEVIGNALSRGAQRGLPSEIVAPIWRALVEAYIAHETSAFDTRQGEQSRTEATAPR